MEYKQVEQRALEVRGKYRQLEMARLGREWTLSEMTEGFVGDVGSLMKLVMAKQGIRVIDDVDEKLKDEICDCLWATICIANRLGIDLESEFAKKMDVLNVRVENSLKDPVKAD